METLYRLDPPLTTTHHLLINGVSKAYPTANGTHVVLADIHLEVHRGEFVCFIGHSGCGKTTLLNMVAGFTAPSCGEISLNGIPVRQPGPDRMMVFQNYALLPWLTAYQNIELAVKSVYPHKTRQRRRQIVAEHLELVGLTAAAHKRPSQLSGGMKQRVAIARALAIRPEVLILDEPFGALDAITKEELQEELLQIWQDHPCTVLMITHDIDEALFLADKLVMMTNGPAAKIGEVLEIPFPRPRVRSRVMDDPRYKELRNTALDFLFHRFAHSEEPAATETVNSVSFSSKDASNPSNPSNPLNPSRLLSLRNGSIALAAAASICLLGSVLYAQSQHNQLKRGNNKITPAPQVSAPSAISSDPATQPSEITTNQPETTATPNISKPSIPSPSVTSVTPVTPEITDPTQISELNWKLYDIIDQNWQQFPTFTEDLIYLVKVNSYGDIFSYQPSNQAASDYLQETPFPDLVDTANPASRG
ncbi:nitrate ABC transporter ATP-binding protein, partial [Parathermosynechococcus lividus]